MEVRVPVGQGAVGLDRCDDADGEAWLTQGRADERGDGARGNPREVAKQGAVVEQVRPEPLGYREHHLPVWFARERGLFVGRRFTTLLPSERALQWQRTPARSAA